MKNVFIVEDEYRMAVSATMSKATAVRQLKVLARYSAWNRRTEIVKETEDAIYFSNFDSVRIKEVPVLSSKKDFMRHFGFQERYKEDAKPSK